MRDLEESAAVEHMHNVKSTNVQEKQEQNLNVFGASGFVIKVLAFSELWAP